MSNPRDTTEFLLGEIHTKVTAIAERQEAIELIVNNLEAEHNQRKGVNRLITAAVGLLSGIIGGHFGSQ